MITDPAPVTALSPIVSGANHHRVGSDEHIIADHRLMLLVTVVVAGDRTRTDVGPGPNRGVAEIGEAGRLGAFSERGSWSRRRCPPWRPSPGPCPVAAMHRARPHSLPRQRLCGAPRTTRSSRLRWRSRRRTHRAPPGPRQPPLCCPRGALRGRSGLRAGTVTVSST